MNGMLQSSHVSLTTSNSESTGYRPINKFVKFRVSKLRIIPPFCSKGEGATPSWSQRVLCSAPRRAHCSAAEEPSLTFNQKIKTVSNRTTTNSRSNHQNEGESKQIQQELSFFFSLVPVVEGEE